MRREIEAAGFVFDAESNVLRNRSDNHKSSVFDASVRGRTDQIVYRFRKPG
jgi:predicted methyltransferase